ncbi:flagellar motor protein MotP [Ligilactobacillus salitolerans]|uniref:Flagellar motor protein MotP n=1 Tax=Ligilactobacillus salitolerans TaxID=1808352 RepID=A0A401IVZ6_9LACO|nr:MotA/TolQ/ExbB proton channel family protein [Ligilactobacillus salitolerans]GBG95714.1 flagellar motor protein MotP [Ligilactobacillus salitolerans]
MDLFLVLGVIAALIIIVTGMLLKGASLAVLFSPEAMMIIFGGIIVALINGYPLSDIKRFPGIFKVLFQNRTYDYRATINKLVDLSNVARREGLLALETPVNNLDPVEDTFLKRGMEMVVDGIDKEQIEVIMQNEIDSTEERHARGAAMFQTAGSTSPTLGVMGAVIGLIGALGHLNNVNVLGESISSAFVATLFGIFCGYLLFLPFAKRLKRKSQQELQQMELIMAGTLAIEEGVSAKTMEHNLESMISEVNREQIEKNK